MNLSSILVVDADNASRIQVVRELRELGHDVAESCNAVDALQTIRERRPDLMVLEWMLPDLAGLELLSDVRRSEDLKPVRVLMTSGRGDPDDVVTALESGADDFIGKPYTMSELLARVGACLRRPPGPHNADKVMAGGLTIDNVGHRVIADGNYLSLAPREYRLLLFLMTNQDRVFSRRQLLIHVWDRDAAVGARTVDVHIRRLRSLLEPYRCAAYLQTVRGNGYRFSLTA